MATIVKVLCLNLLTSINSFMLKENIKVNIMKNLSHAKQKNSFSLFIIFLLISLIFSSSLYSSQVVNLTNKKEVYELGKHLEIFEDKEGKLTIDDIRSPEYSNQFNKSKVKSPNYGFTSSVFWARISFENNSHKLYPTHSVPTLLNQIFVTLILLSLKKSPNIIMFCTTILFESRIKTLTYSRLEI